jgi:hypothetical protein
LPTRTIRPLLDAWLNAWVLSFAGDTVWQSSLSSRPVPAMIMRIVTWNCATALHGKYERLLALRPDIAIVPDGVRGT